MITLYHYLHCPYCIRIRMALGYLKIPYNSNLLPYADEKTPLGMTGKKMAPILQKADGTFMNESLDIIQYLDQKNLLNTKLVLNSKDYLEFAAFLDNLSIPLFNLAMPFFCFSPEFNDRDRAYFIQKKSLKRGPISELSARRPFFEAEIYSHLTTLESKLNPFYKSLEFTIIDLLLASHLWSLYSVPEFRFSEKIHLYLQNIKTICSFNNDQDLWHGLRL